MSRNLAGKVALVTGGARGVGAATAARLAEQGARVHVADLDRAQESAVAGSSSPPFTSPPVMWHCLDVTDRRGWDDLVAEIVQTEGGLDILHLNAGIQARPVGSAGDDDPLLWFDDPLCDRLMAVNVKGVTNGIMACLPALRISRGSIIVTASMAGVRGFEADPLYAMTKFAVVGLVRSLRSRLARDGVCINAVCPGGVDTRMIPSVARPATGTDFIKPAHIAELVCKLAAGRDYGGVWLAPLDGSVRRYEIDPLAYTEDKKMDLSELVIT